MGAKEKEVKNVRKHKIIAASEYYIKAREVGAGNVRDTALGLLFDEYEGKIVAQVDDKKAGEIKFVVKI